MKGTLMILSVLVILLSCNQDREDRDIRVAWDNITEILDSIVPPVFPDRDFVITDYGAVGDGHTPATAAIREAIEACHEQGGGRVVIPPDTFVTGAIRLLSNVNLYLQEGAVLLFSVNSEDYLPVVRTRFEGCELYNYSPLIYAFRQENIAVTGKGTLDGQATAKNWWAWKLATREEREQGRHSQYDSSSLPHLLEMVNNKVPVEQRRFGKGHFLRPSFIQPYQCENILIEGITVRRPPMWMIHPVLSRNITVRKVKLFSPEAPNGDGCNPECCRNILIEKCVFNTGDDCIALKSGRNRDGYDIGIPTENVIVRDCKMRDGHGGVVIGSELSGGVRNVFVYRCEMQSPRLERALRIKTNKFRGGLVENIFWKDMKVGSVRYAAIRINQNYPAYDDNLPVMNTVIGNIFVERMYCGGAEYAIKIDGSKECPPENIRVVDCTFDNVKKGYRIEGVKGLMLKDVRINGELLNKVTDETKVDE